jgi:diguanylate cyclase (GGDEF)-like protein
MDDWPIQLPTGEAAYAVAAGCVLLVLAGACAAWVVGPARWPAWLRLRFPSGLKPRLTIALVLVATLPAVSVTAVLAERASREHVMREVDALHSDAETAAALRAARTREYGVAAGWLIASLVVSVSLAVALAASITGPLRALDSAVRRFDPEQDDALPAPGAGAPREVLVLFEHMAGLGERLRESYGRLRDSLREGERLQAQLMRTIASREDEIARRTDELRAANAALARLSRSDDLTGLANRRSLTEFIEHGWRAAQREQQPLSVLMIDIDHFKAYNDAYGHPQGDTCLRAVAEAIARVVSRATDLVARYGGEEFVAVLGNTPLEGALDVAEQVRAAIERLAIPHRAAPGHVVTVSVGATSSLPARNTRPDASLAAADRALYAAKAEGRNRVGFSTAARTGLYQSLCLPNGPPPRLS